MTFKGFTTTKMIGEGFRMAFQTQTQLNHLLLSSKTVLGNSITCFFVGFLYFLKYF